MENRGEKGQFVLKSETERSVRSIRATDWVWDEFGFLADSRGITRADLLEQWVKPGGMKTQPTTESSPSELGPIELAIALSHLKKALELKANAGGAIKAEIRAALKILE